MDRLEWHWREIKADQNKKKILNTSTSTLRRCKLIRDTLIKIRALYYFPIIYVFSGMLHLARFINLMQLAWLNEVIV